jgi:alkanesulfonate monooxygenase SsuD/methylene tetrahydromethanopterin reductase-like flavin-dependent oxidoreductase (luciferase family)
MKIWLGSGGSPESSLRAGRLGLPIAYGILNGTAEDWVRVAASYREAGERSGHDPGALEVSVAGHGFIAKDGRAAKENFYRYESSGPSAAPCPTELTSMPLMPVAEWSWSVSRTRSPIG